MPLTTDLIREFYNSLEKQTDKNYLLMTIDYIAAPTLAGLKPATLINFNRSKRDLHSAWKKYKYILEASKELNFYEVNDNINSLQVIFYNKYGLEDALSNKENMRFLKNYGYESKMSTEEHLNLLRKHFDNGCPHEIGIFLGFPLNDVVKFIDNSGKNALFTGYWKVYGNVSQAIAKFKQYDDVKLKVVQLALHNKSPMRVLKELYHD